MAEAISFHHFLGDIYSCTDSGMEFTLEREYDLAPSTRVGMCARRFPDQPQASDYLTLYPGDTTGQRLFKEIINATIDYAYGARYNHDYSFESACMNDKDVCSFAEQGFARTLEFLQNPDQDTSFEGARIFADNDGKPVVLQKNCGVKTGILLQDVAIDDLPYPAGSIVGLHVPRRQEVPDIKERTVTVADISHIAAMGFMRLSVFALEQREREPFLEEWTYMEHALPEAYNLLEEAGPYDFFVTAKTVASGYTVT